MSYTDRLLDAGFDGAYLDIIDAYEYYQDQRPTAAQEMVDFVAAIRAYARASDPDFYIFPQNAPELASLVPGYLNVVDGIGQEDIYYGYDDDDEMTPPAVTAEMESYLDLWQRRRQAGADGGLCHHPGPRGRRLRQVAGQGLRAVCHRARPGPTDHQSGARAGLKRAAWCAV